MIHANLTPDMARVILANLPFQPMDLRPEDTPIWVEAVDRLREAAPRPRLVGRRG